MDLTVVIFAE
jgi:hypothetical protein